MIEKKSRVIGAGDVYGRFTVIGTFEEEKRMYAKVQCSCGSPQRYVRTDGLRNGASQSCGCLMLEKNTTHGRWNDPIFITWRAMISRCTNPKDKRYSRYGERGITVCERWLTLENFLHDMEGSFSKGLTIDRIDNNGNYEPSNCRWSTRGQQNRNYSRNLVLHHNGKSMCAIDWALELNINPKTIYDRKSRGWSDEDTLLKPVKSSSQ